MTQKQQRLKLTWIGEEERPRLEPRILLEDWALTPRSDAGFGGESLRQLPHLR